LTYLTVSCDITELYSLCRPSLLPIWQWREKPQLWPFPIIWPSIPARGRRRKLPKQSIWRWFRWWKMKTTATHSSSTANFPLTFKNSANMNSLFLSIHSNKPTISLWILLSST